MSVKIAISTAAGPGRRGARCLTGTLPLTQKSGPDPGQWIRAAFELLPRREPAASADYCFGAGAVAGGGAPIGRVGELELVVAGRASLYGSNVGAFFSSSLVIERRSL